MFVARLIRFFTVLVSGEPWPHTGRQRSDFLYASPSFTSGAARTLDLFGHFDAYNYSPSSHEADRRALSADWQVVGDDMRDAIDLESERAERELAVQ